MVLAMEAAPRDIQVMISRFQQKQRSANAGPGCTFPLFLSLGTTCFDPANPAETIDELIARADQELYRCKAARRESRTGPISNPQVLSGHTQLS